MYDDSKNIVLQISVLRNILPAIIARGTKYETMHIVFKKITNWKKDPREFQIEFYFKPI